MTRFLLLVVLATSVSAQVRSSQRIPIRKEKPHVDTVRIHDTVKIVRVDTVRVVVAIVDTIRLVRVDTLTDSTCRQGYFPFPIPIPIGRDARDMPPLGTTITPEPSTMFLTATGLGVTAVFLRFTRR